MIKWYSTLFIFTLLSACSGDARFIINKEQAVKSKVIINEKKPSPKPRTKIKVPPEVNLCSLLKRIDGKLTYKDNEASKNLFMFHFQLGANLDHVILKSKKASIVEAFKKIINIVSPDLYNTDIMLHSNYTIQEEINKYDLNTDTLESFFSQEISKQINMPSDGFLVINPYIALESLFSRIIKYDKIHFFYIKLSDFPQELYMSKEPYDQIKDNSGFYKMYKKYFPSAKTSWHHMGINRNCVNLNQHGKFNPDSFKRKHFQWDTSIDLCPLFQDNSVAVDLVTDQIIKMDKKMVLSEISPKIIDHVNLLRLNFNNQYRHIGQFNEPFVHETSWFKDDSFNTLKLKNNIIQIHPKLYPCLSKYYIANQNWPDKDCPDVSQLIQNKAEIKLLNNFSSWDLSPKNFFLEVRYKCEQ